jgi:hypothetical protein
MNHTYWQEKLDAALTSYTDGGIELEINPLLAARGIERGRV